MVEKFVSTHLRLLEKERDAEIEETRVLTEKLPAKELQRRGVCLTKLRIAGRRTGYYGRVIVTFEPSGFNKELPSHNFTPGDIAGLSQTSEEKFEELASGIVTRASSTSVCVAFDDKEEIFSLDDDLSYRLQKLANDVTYKRLKKALTKLENLSPCPASQLVGVLFGQRELTPPYLVKEIHYINSKLDDSQKEAVRFALSQPEVAVVHGPPGTGKTTTVVEIITQAVKQGMKILVCAPSNIAVDNLVERLAANKLKIIRLGHPARVLPHIQKYSLDAILSTSDETRLVEDVRKDLDNTWFKIKKTRDKGEQQRLRGEMKYLRKELRQREETATKELLKRADVILSTLTSASEDGPLKLLEDDHFNITVIDECSQAVEAACWIPLLKAPRCVLAGDHLQLPPTILSQEAAKSGLEETLMERIIDLYHNKVVRMLTTQYRMHQHIMQWSSVQLYHSKLTAHSSVKEHLLRDLPGIDTETEESECPLMLVDTAGCELYEMDISEEISKGNEGEADIVSCHVEKLVKMGLAAEDIAVIAPYNLQVELLRLRIWPKYPKVEVKSVDGFQGREKEAVVISLVRSNNRGEVGFLAEKRRINVAVTRARRHLMVVCDSDTVSHDEFLQSLVTYLNSNGQVKTAQEYIDDGLVNNEIIRPEHLEDLLTSHHHKGARQKTTGTKGNKNKTGNKHHTVPKDETKVHEIPKKYNDEDEVENKRQEFQGYLDKFMSNENENILEFPPDLNSYERMLIHELAEKMSLQHVSKGEDKKRHIVISKPGISTGSQKKSLPSSDASVASTSYTAVSSVDSTSYTAVSSVEKEKNEQPNTNSETGGDQLTCPHCSKNVIRANYNLHEMNCLRHQRDRAKSATEKQNSKKCTVSSEQDNVKKKRPPSHTAKIEKVDADDFEGLISAAQSLDSHCAFKKCKVKVKTLGQNCEFCMRRFCLSHHTPEIHGCGDVAKAQARATQIREGILYRSSLTAPPLPDPAKKANLQKRLDKKINDLANQRKGQNKKSKNK